MKRVARQGQKIIHVQIFWSPNCSSSPGRLADDLINFHDILVQKRPSSWHCGTDHLSVAIVVDERRIRTGELKLPTAACTRDFIA